MDISIRKNSTVHDCHTTIWCSLLPPYVDHPSCLEARAALSKWGNGAPGSEVVRLRSDSWQVPALTLEPSCLASKVRVPSPISDSVKSPSPFCINRLPIICPLAETIDLRFLPAETLSSKRHFSEVSIAEHQNGPLWQVIQFPLLSFSKITKERSCEIYTSSR